MAGDHEPPRSADPRLAGVADADPRRRDGRPAPGSRRRVLEPERRRRVAQVESRSSRRSIPKAAATRPGPLARRSSGVALEPGQLGGLVPAEAAPPLRGARAPGRPASSSALERLDGADEQGGRRSRPGPVTTLRQSYIP